jgi:hypothetical protein
MSSSILSRGVSRRTATLAAFALVAGGGLALASQAHADGPVCTPTGYTQDSIDLTAAVIAVQDQSVTGPVDATACNIGVYVGPGVDASVDGASIDGHPNYYGVLVNGGSASVTGSTVNDIGETPPNGTQHGVAIAFINGATGTVAGNDVERYQKGGVVVKGSAVDTTANTVVGLDPVAFIAQNGVQYSQSATGSISGNEIDANDYTGCSSQAAAKTGCIAYVSTGLLMFGVDPNAVKASNNHFRNDQRNQYMGPNASL